MIFTNNTFEGHWPVGTAAVVEADNCYAAAGLLEKELEKQGLKQKISHNSMIPKHDKKVVILCSGDY